MLAEQHSQGSPLSKVVENNFGTRNGIEQNDVMKTLTSGSIISSGGAAMLYTGLDLHKSFSYITTMNDKGQIVGQKKVPSNGEVVEFLRA